MARRVGDATVVVQRQVLGAKSAAATFSRMPEAMQREFLVEMARLRDDVTKILKTHAPVGETGELRDTLEGDVRFTKTEGLKIVWSAPAKSARGYPYVLVTRFGHRKATIRPRTSVRFHGWPSEGYGGKEIFPKEIRGYRPVSDWVERAIPEVDERVEASAARIGRIIAAGR